MYIMTIDQVIYAAYKRINMTPMWVESYDTLFLLHSNDNWSHNNNISLSNSNRIFLKNYLKNFIFRNSSTPFHHSHLVDKYWFKCTRRHISSFVVSALHWIECIGFSINRRAELFVLQILAFNQLSRMHH